MKNIKIILFLGIIIGAVSCKKYLDIVPDYSPTIDNAFSMRTQAKKYLATCYSYLPKLGEYSDNFTFVGSREIVAPTGGVTSTVAPGLQPFLDVAYGYQGANDPVANYWDGAKSGTPLFQGLRDCNIFLESVEKVPDMSEAEKKQWIAEVKTLKAYYHFYLLRMYGPIPVIRKNLPISASADEVQVKREPVDSVVSYIVQLVDEATPDLLPAISNVSEEMGRITQTIALSIKAQTLVLAASPLFNGNADYANFKNKDGQALVNTTFDATKWQKATDACKNAIEAAHAAGHTMHYFEPPVGFGAIFPSTKASLDIRSAITEDFNVETIWGFKNSRPNNLQLLAMTFGGGTSGRLPIVGNAFYAANMAACELFYTKNGVPIDEDPTWDYANRYTALKSVPNTPDSGILKKGFVTSTFNMDRENRFYADLAFQGSSYEYKTYINSDKIAYLVGYGSATATDKYSMTGYWPKKLVNYKCTGDQNTRTIVPYTWPAIRLSELYLMYAEALNESAGPSQEAYQYIDSVRARAGLKGVVESWTKYSNNAAKHTTKEGLRSIIQQETQIEFMFEGNNYWNARRWMRLDILNRPVTGWDVFKKSTVPADAPKVYYNKVNYFYPAATLKDFLAPIKEYNLSVNHNLVQNPMW
jgi:starch-binding outer membrane protein, SusD/RagB family